MGVPRKQLHSWLKRAKTLFKKIHELADEANEGEIHDQFINAAIEIGDAEALIKKALGRPARTTMSEAELRTLITNQQLGIKLFSK